MMLIGVRKASSYLKIMLELNKSYVLGFVSSTQPTEGDRTVRYSSVDPDSRVAGDRRWRSGDSLGTAAATV